MSCWTALPNSAQGCHVGSLVSAMRLYLHDRNWKMLQIRAFLLREPVVKPLLMAITLVNSALAKGENSDLLITVEHRVWINIDAGDPERHTGPSIRVRGAYGGR